MNDIPSSALSELSRIVGPENLSADDKIRASLARTTLPEGTIPAGVIRPADRDQVQQIMRCAFTHKIPVYPVSTGKNWGYGDVCAPMPGCLILDLSRMNKIVEVNVKLAFAVLEPGVTQGQLSDYLRKNNFPLLMDCTGAGPDAGFVGNTLERGFGHSPYGDRFAHSCNYEVVLADGSLLSTGFGNFPGALAQHLYKWGIGPSLDGLFAQSNFGVVTRMTVWLMPKPQAVNYYFVGLSKPEAMAEMVERLRPLYLNGSLRNVLHCANDHRLLASSMRFPWDEADGKSSLDTGHPDVYQRLYRKYNLLAWSCAGVISGTADEVKAVRRHMKEALRGINGLDKCFFLSDRLYEISQRISHRFSSWKLWNSLVRDLNKVKWMVELLRGQSSYQFLSGAHWRARREPQGKLDPLETGAGLIWLGPVLPMTGEAVEEVRRIGDTVFHQFGFEHQLTFSFLNERSLAAIVSISFDHASAEECERAKQCEKELLKAYLAKGFAPYRGSASVQRQLIESSPAYWDQLKKLQQAWDPNGILSPGHYSKT